MNMRQVVLDTETTGLSPKEGHHVIEIGCVELINRLSTGNNFHCYINPGREVGADAIAIHGITNEFLADKPPFSAIADDMIRYIEGAELIIHNAPFDVGFLDHEMHAVNPSYKRVTGYCSVFDTLTYARKKHPGQHNSLDALCRRYHVDNSNREFHGALLDAQLLAEVYLAMTGGQTSLFEEDSGKRVSTRKHVDTAEAQVRAREPLRIIRATPEEEAAHLARLKAIKEAS